MQHTVYCLVFVYRSSWIGRSYSTTYPLRSWLNYLHSNRSMSQCDVLKLGSFPYPMDVQGNRTLCRELILMWSADFVPDSLPTTSIANSPESNYATDCAQSIVGHFILPGARIFRIRLLDFLNPIQKMRSEWAFKDPPILCFDKSAPPLCCNSKLKAKHVDPIDSDGARVDSFTNLQRYTGSYLHRLHCIGSVSAHWSHIIPSFLDLMTETLVCSASRFHRPSCTFGIVERTLCGWKSWLDSPRLWNL